MRRRPWIFRACAESVTSVSASGEWRGGKFPGVSIVTCTHRLQGTVTRDRSMVQAVRACRGPRCAAWQAVERGVESGTWARSVALANWTLTLLRTCPRQGHHQNPSLRHPPCGHAHTSVTSYLGHVSLFTWKPQSLVVRIRNWCV